MMPTAFGVLDKLVHAGAPLDQGSLLDAATPKKTGTALLKQLKTDGLIGVKSGKHSITPEGLEEWKRQAPPEGLAVFEERERQRERGAIVEFLRVVVAKKGKALGAKEQPKFPEGLREKAIAQGLVEALAANAYKLLPAGEMALLADQPIDQQITRLKEQHAALGKGWQAASSEILGKLTSLGGTELESVRSVAVRLDEQQRQAFADLEAVLRHLETLGGLADAATAFRQRLATMTADAETAAATARHLAAELARIEQAAGEHAHRIEGANRQLAERLDDLEKRPASAPPPVALPQGPTDAELWETTKGAYQRLYDEMFRHGGIVKIPELTDLVRKAHPGVSPATFHEALQEWQRQDKLTLQLCNDPHLEPRHAEGIHSGRGLLFYVQTR